MLAILAMLEDISLDLDSFIITIFPFVLIPQCGNFIIFLSLKILREINFGDSRIAQSAILTHLEALNLDFYESFLFFKADIYQSNKNQISKISKKW